MRNYTFAVRIIYKYKNTISKIFKKKPRKLEKGFKGFHFDFMRRSFGNVIESNFIGNVKFWAVKNFGGLVNFTAQNLASGFPLSSHISNFFIFTISIKSSN